MKIYRIFVRPKFTSNWIRLTRFLQCIQLITWMCAARDKISVEIRREKKIKKIRLVWGSNPCLQTGSTVRTPFDYLSWFAVTRTFRRVVVARIELLVLERFWSGFRVAPWFWVVLSWFWAVLRMWAIVVFGYDFSKGVFGYFSQKEMNHRSNEVRIRGEFLPPRSGVGLK